MKMFPCHSPKLIFLPLYVKNYISVQLLKICFCQDEERCIIIFFFFYLDSFLSMKPSVGMGTPFYLLSKMFWNSSWNFLKGSPDVKMQR